MIANYKGQVTVPAHFSVEGKPATAEQAITNAFHQIMGTTKIQLSWITNVHYVILTYN